MLRQNNSSDDIYKRIVKIHRKPRKVDTISGFFKKQDLILFFQDLEKSIEEKLDVFPMPISFCISSKAFSIIVSYSRDTLPHWTFIDAENALPVEKYAVIRKIGTSLQMAEMAGCQIEIYASKKSTLLTKSLTKRFRKKWHDFTNDLHMDIAEKTVHLHEAIQFGYIKLVALLLDSGLNPDTLDKAGMSPLVASIKYPDCGIFNSLIKHKANIHLIDQKGFTALHEAVEKNKYIMIEKLLEMKANVNQCAYNGCTPLYLAVKNGDVTQIKKLLEAKANPNLTLYTGESPLMVAAASNFKNTTKLLIQYKANVHQGYNDLGTSLLHAAKQGNMDIINTLVAAGANISSLAINDKGASPLIAAAEEGQLETVKWLIAEKADLDLTFTTGHSAIGFAIMNKHVEVFKTLLKAGANLHLPNIYKQTLLHLAVSSGQLEIVEILIAEGMDINAIDIDGETPLHSATRKGHKDIIIALLKAGANPNIKNENKIAPLCIAVCKDSIEITKILLENKANPDQRTSFDTPLLSFAKMLKSESQQTIAKLLDEAGASHIPSGQDFIIDRMKTIKIEGHNEGVCFGMVCMAAQAFFAGKFQDFLKRIELIARIPKEEFEKYMNTLKSDYLKLLEKAKKSICEELAKEYGLTLNPDILWSAKLSSEQIQKILSFDRFKRVLMSKREPKLEDMDSDALAVVNENEQLTVYWVEYGKLMNKSFPEESVQAITKMLPVIGESSTDVSLIHAIIAQYDCANDFLNNAMRAWIANKVNAKVQEYKAEAKEDDLSFEIPAFLQGVEAYLFSRRYLELFPKDMSVDNQNFQQTLPLIASKALKPEDIIAVDSIDGIYTKKELVFYFMSLYEAFANYRGKVMFGIESINHAMGLFSDSEVSPMWGFLDPNVMPLRPLSKEDMAKHVMSGFRSEQVLALHLKIYASKKEMAEVSACIQAWKQHPQWQAMHTLTKSRVSMEDSWKATLLHLAVIRDNLSLVKALLEAKANPEHHKANGTSPLRIAAQNGKIEMIKLLKSHGASLEARDEKGFSSLHVAAQQGQLDTVKFLLQEGLNPNIENKFGYTPLQCAAIANRLEVVNLLIEAKSDIHKKGENQTALLQASLKGHANIVRALLKAKANCDDMDINQHATAVYGAAQNGHTEVVRILVEAKANLEVKYDGKTPIFVAVEKGHSSIVKFLLEVDPERFKNSSGEYNNSLLTCAARLGHVEIVRDLLAVHADVNNCNALDRNALHLAVENGHADVVQLLLDAKADLKIKNLYDKSPLEIAIKEKHADIARLLLEAGASITPLSLYNIFIAEKNNPTAMQAIIRDVLKKNPIDINQIDEDGQTIAYHAAYDNQYDFIKILAEAGADLQKSNNANWTPLRIAIRNKAKKIVELLIQPEYKLDLNKLMDDGETPVCIAAMYGNLDALKSLQNAGADLQKPNKNGLTPLMHAIINQRTECAKFLILNTDNINALSADGHTAAFFTARESNKEILELLIKKGADLNLGKKSDKPFFEAAQTGFVEGLRLMMQPECKVDINESLLFDDPEVNHATAVMAAAACGREAAVELLAEAKADLYKTTDNGFTPLHWAAMNNRDNVIAPLLKYKMAINVRNAKTGETAVFIAAANNQLESLKTLTDSKADISVPDHKGMTLLHMAAKNGHLDAVRLLLQQNAKTFSLDNEKHSAIYYAIQNKHWSIVRYLLQALNVNLLNVEDRKLIQLYQKEILWSQYEASAYSTKTGRSPIVSMLMQSSSLFKKLHDDILIENRQNEYDINHGVVVYQPIKSIKY